MSTTEPVDALEATDAYPKYDEHKDSGVEWLGEIPVHWQTTRVQRVADIHPSSVDKKSEEDETPVKLCNYTDVYYGSRITDESGFMEATATASEIETHELRAGDVLVTKDSEARDDIAVPALVGRDMPGVICGYHLAQLRPSDRIDGAYLYYSLKSPSVSAQFEASATGITRYGLGVHALKKSHLYLPPLDEQRAIATFLDRETGRIDALIEKKEELIDLLEEKRTALISRVVTKGLNRDVEMQDSGVEWLSEIPGHWKTVKLKYLTECLDNRRIPLNSEERGAMQGDIPYWGANGVVDHVDDWLFDEKIVLLGEDGAPFFEKNEPVSFLVDEKVWVNNHAHILKAGKRLLPEFLVHVLNAVDYGGFIGGSTRDKLNQSEMGNIWVQLPPLEEQRTIVTFLDRETGRIDTLIDNVEDAINQLEEYRTALISAAVTGQIDVREEIPAVPAE